METERRKIVVDTGSVVLDIEDTHGKYLGQIELIPTDSDIIKRYKDVVDKLNGTKLPENPQDEDIIAFSDMVKEQVNYLMNYDVSSSVFSVCGPLTALASGDFYFENVLNAIGGAIEQIMNTRVEKRLAKIRNATAKYHK